MKYVCACVCVCTWQTGGLGWFGSGQSGCKLGLGKKWVILSGLKMGSSQSGCGLSRVDPFFTYIYIYILKKITCICNLESHATNYLI